jgi:hypothetical protein
MRRQEVGAKHVAKHLKLGDARRPEQVLDSHIDFARKCSHVEDYLRLNGVRSAREDARQWCAAFFDELDPLPCVREWFESGYKDPKVVNAALRFYDRPGVARVASAHVKRRAVAATRASRAS